MEGATASVGPCVGDRTQMEVTLECTIVALCCRERVFLWFPLPGQMVHANEIVRTAGQGHILS
jgi:hypothetical protein